MDEKTTLSALRRRVAQFIAARDWEQFHTPKNLSAAIAIERAVDDRRGPASADIESRTANVTYRPIANE